MTRYQNFSRWKTDTRLRNSKATMTNKSISKIIKPLRGGQITIPFEFRQKLGIKEDTLLRVTLENDELRIRKVELREVSQGSPWLQELYQLLAPVRADLANYTEEDINTAIDEALKKIRRKKRA